MKKYGDIFDKYFWIPVILLTILTYGFTLSNYSIGIDDASLFWYIDWKVLVSQGRWGYELISPIVNVSSFLPFWLDLLTIYVYLVTTVLWTILFYEASNRKLVKEGCIIFSCLYISFPFLAEIFIFMAADLLSGFTMLFAVLAVREFYKGFERRKFICFIISSLYIAIGYGFYESVIVYFLLGVTICSFLNEIWVSKGGVKKVLCNISIAFVVMCVGFLISRIILNYFVEHYNITPNSYANQYFSYCFDITIMEQILITFKELFFYICSQKDTVNGTLATSILIIVSSVLYYSVKNKTIAPIIWGVSIIVSNFAIILGTGNLSIMQNTKRILFTYGLFTSFAISFSVSFLQDIKIDLYWIKQIKKIVKYAILLGAFVLIIRQSREMVGLFYVDHKRAVLDERKASYINYEIEKTDWQNKAIIFLGSSPDYLSTQNQDPLASYFNYFKDRTEAEINNYISYYMSEVGYVYPIALKEGEIEQAIKESKDQMCYPKTGYVTEYNDYIVVKLGNTEP